MADFTPFQSPTRIDMNSQGYGIVQYGDDQKLCVMFYTRAVEDPVQSRALGRKICHDVPHVKINHPGERDQQIDRPVTEQDKMRFPHQWSQFVHNRTQIPDGTPIDLLFPNQPSIAENLRAMGVHTIEQCAALSAHGQNTIGMGSQEYVTKALNYLKSAEKGVGFLKLNEELKKRDQDIKILTQQIATQRRQIDDLMAKIMNPGGHSQSPPWQPGYDAQAERINNTHVTKELSKKKVSTKKVEPPKEVIEEIEQIEDSGFDIDNI